MCVYMHGVVAGEWGRWHVFAIREHRIDFSAFSNEQTVHFTPFQASDDFSSAHPPWGMRWMVSDFLALHHQRLDQKHPKRRGGIKKS